jgi:alkylmercury lyase
MTVDPNGRVGDLSPATAVISIPDSEELDVARVRVSCCHPGRFFATADAAAGWRARYPSGTVLPVADAHSRVHQISTRLLD